MASGIKRKSDFYAVSVTGGMEEKVAQLIAERTRILGYDIRSIVVSPTVKGFIILEVGDPADLYMVIRGMRHAKRRRPLKMKKEEVVSMARPVVELAKVERGQIVEVIGGPFKGMRGKVVDVYESRGELDITLLESDFQMTVTVSLTDVKPIEEEETEQA